MKILTIFGAFLLVVLHQTTAKPTNPASTTFSDDFANLTYAIYSSNPNINNMGILVAKISAFIHTSYKHNIQTSVYNSIYGTLNRLAYAGSDMRAPEQALDVINKIQNSFDEDFDYLNKQRDVDASLLPSVINNLIDDFVNSHLVNIVDMFNDIYIQSRNLEIESENLAANLVMLMDSLVENVEKCLPIARFEFRKIFECHAATRTILPSLAHDTALIEIIRQKIGMLPWSLPNGTSLYEYEHHFSQEKYDLMLKIQDERKKREQ